MNTVGAVSHSETTLLSGKVIFKLYRLMLLNGTDGEFRQIRQFKGYPFALGLEFS